MLDKRTTEFLKIINSNSTEGAFKVLEISNVLNKMPSKYKIDYDSIVHMAEYLKERDFVTIKYVDEQEICLAPLPKGRLYDEKEKELKKEKRKGIRLIILMVISSGVAAFLGALLSKLIPL